MFKSRQPTSKRYIKNITHLKKGKTMEKVKDGVHVIGASLSVRIENGDDLDSTAKEKISAFIAAADAKFEAEADFKVKDTYFLSATKGVIKVGEEYSVSQDDLYDIDEDDEGFGACIYIILTLTDQFYPSLFMDISADYEGDFYGYFYTPLYEVWKQAQYESGEIMSGSFESDVDGDMVKSLVSFVAS